VDPVVEIEGALSRKLVDEDGNDVTLDLRPALSPVEIDDLQAEIGVPLPVDLRSLLEMTTGFDGPLETIDFTGRSLSFEDRDIFPSGLPIAHDGFGNHWVVDLTPDDAPGSRIFFACHDAPVVLYRSPDLGHFLHETFRLLEPPHASLVDGVHEDRLFRVWRENPGTLDHAAAIRGDAELRDFATETGDRFLFVDLRDTEIGMGFSWGRFGPRTEVRRHGYSLLFAYAPPERRPGLLSRLRGR
jgi:hypothetical protein